MQKYTSVLATRKFNSLLAAIVVIACWFNTAAHAAVSPIPLLVEQCLSYQFPTALSDSSLEREKQASDIQAIELERELIGFFNINDRIKYYRQFPLNYGDRELLLQCQLYLADELALFFNSAKFQSIQFALAGSDDPSVKSLAMRLNRLAKNTDAPNYKAQLHTAQAAFKQGVSSQSLSLNFLNEQCKLGSNNDDNTSTVDFNDSLASYLIKQPDETCRQQVWQAYQARASSRNETPLARILDLRQQQAKQASFTDYSHQQLHQQWLSTPKLVAQFLNSQTQAINIAPWNLGLALSQAEPVKVNTVSSKRWLQEITTELEAFAIAITPVNDKLYRVWLDGRLLGDIYITLGAKNQAKPIRKQVVGQQFGQFELILKPELKTYQQQATLVDAVAGIISQLASGQRFYLANTIGETQDTAQIDTLWLQQYLKGQLLPDLKQDSREALLQQYALQLQVFRAKVALNTYLASDSPLKFNLETAFSEAFGTSWDNIHDAPYTYSAIAFEGPVYYQSLWQKALANYIYQSTKDCQNQKLVFDYLVVNESSSKLANTLQLLLGEPITNDSLIKRTQYAFNHQDQHPRRCTLLHK
ncbi:M3 family metallopeptidase [Shewanella schlegeliana]|uniref:Peptidase M3 n=1 Tax=Shewanella schlegeliana TaxID=190308 RepID=A0ABS1STZ0_9GAMM|nr:M3 family metallopeptidase [Shewanella schlegeliana]MBL4912011.1 peptidase M3 [Shewanella schlegeliana]MCL1111613.1 M3 family metallopeptidase [Shewanella schlegeliana]GIU35326.1 Zn-dependent oligopeptidase [Shewanella schlegeliana]